jgi:hypothetical protein
MDVLVVRQAFGDRQVGEMIRGDDIAATLEAGQGHFCTRSTVEDSFFASEAPAPTKAQAAPPAPAPQPAADQA